MKRPPYQEFRPMEPLIIFPANGGNGIKIAPVRGGKLLEIGKEEHRSLYSIDEITKFLDKHFALWGRNRAT